MIRRRYFRVALRINIEVVPCSVAVYIAMRTSCTLPIVFLEILRNRVWGVLDNPARLGCLRIGWI